MPASAGLCDGCSRTPVALLTTSARQPYRGPTQRDAATPASPASKPLGNPSLRTRSYCWPLRPVVCERPRAARVGAADGVRPEPNALVADGPTWFERLCAALMYVLPLSEGIYRLALVSVRYCKRHSLEFLFWCNVQHNNVAVALSSKVATEYTKEDMVALQTLIQMSQRFYAWLSQSAERLLNLSVPEKAQHASTMLGTWASSFFSTPDALWHFAFLLYMSIVAGLAGLELDKRRAAGRKGRSGWFCKPELLSVSYFCALLLRVSWAPLEGMSDLSFELYRLGATLLTLITTIVAATQVQKLLCGEFTKIHRALDEMVQQATSIAHLHRNFLLLDWLLCLFSQVPLGTKCLRSLLLLVYWLAVSALEGEAQTAKELPSSL